VLIQLLAAGVCADSRRQIGAADYLIARGPLAFPQCDPRADVGGGCELSRAQWPGQL